MMNENCRILYNAISKKRIDLKRNLTFKEFLEFINNSHIDLNSREIYFLESYAESMLSFDELKLAYFDINLSKEDKLNLRRAFYNLSKNLVSNYNNLCYTFGYASEVARAEKHKIAPVIVELISFIQDRKIDIDEDLVEFWLPSTYLSRKIS